jgi:hypothetical protein
MFGGKIGSKGGSVFPRGFPCVTIIEDLVFVPSLENRIRNIKGALGTAPVSLVFHTRVTSHTGVHHVTSGQ